MFDSDSGLGININAEFVDKRWNLDGRDFDGKREKELPRYGVVTAGITREISGMKIFVNIDNIFDKKYKSRWEYPLPGRTLEGGMKIRF